jgi:hypothetical protein
MALRRNRTRYLLALEDCVRNLVAEATLTHDVVHARTEAARLEDAFPECDMSKEEIARLIAGAARAACVELGDGPPAFGPHRHLPGNRQKGRGAAPDGEPTASKPVGAR